MCRVWVPVCLSTGPKRHRQWYGARSKLESKLVDQLTIKPTGPAYGNVVAPLCGPKTHP